MQNTQRAVGRPPGIETSDTSDETDISIGNVCHVLQNERRRLVLEYLQTVEGPIRTRDIAEAVAARENEVAREQLGHSERKRTYISLYQVHLRTLDDAGVIDYDHDRGLVESLPVAERFYSVLDCIEDIAAQIEPPDSKATAETARRWDNLHSKLPFIVGVTILIGFVFGAGLGNEIVNVLL